MGKFGVKPKVCFEFGEPQVERLFINAILLYFADKEVLNGVLYVYVCSGKGFHRNGTYAISSIGLVCFRQHQQGYQQVR